MYNGRHRLEATVRSVVVATLLSGMALAQGPRAAMDSPPPDFFAAWHTHLSDAADRALAAALANRPFMKDPEVATTAAGRASTTGPDALVRLRAAVQRVRQIQPAIEPILRQEGVPTELSAIVLVESGGQLTALSPKGARGVWQFMPETARRYGLAVTAGHDERLEIVKSTRAAARYLRDLYQQFGDWQLAFAAYNAGEQAVEQAVARTGQQDFSGIQRALPQETRNYVPAVLNAMATLGRKPEGALPAVNPGGPAKGRLLYASAKARE